MQDPQLSANQLITASMMPSGDACGGGGSGYINALDAFTGTSSGTSYFDLDNDGTPDNAASGLPIGSVNYGVGMPTLPNILRGLMLVGGTDTTQPPANPLRRGWDRVSWREIRQD